ncbi:ATP-binding protein [Blautia sp. MSJ-9]|uniref:ATP-binding protein n=1 Tax=Blautia sp. MSJ-9 TaxID=2841511 RepID=UPI002FE6C9F9
MNLKSITAEAKIENIVLVTDFVNSILEKNECSMKVQMEIDIVIDEIFSNIAYYAYAPGSGEATVQVEIEDSPKRLELVFIDRGIPYNPLENKDPDVTLDIEERKIGGLGIFLVKEMMDEVLYEYVDGQNILKLIKDL